MKSTTHDVSEVQIGIDWKKFDKLQTKVERRSSDVTLEKMHAGDRRENETICASLKKYQTLPPKVALHSLVSRNCVNTLYNLKPLIYTISIYSFSLLSLYFSLDFRSIASIDMLH